MIETFRNATIEDLPQIVKIYNKAIEDGFSTADSVEVTADEKVDWFRSHDKKRYPILIKEYRGKIIAWVSLQPFYPHAAYDKSARINVYIDTNFRGKKLGQMFLKQVLDMAREYEIENYLALIFADNETSIKLFKKLGFKEWGCFPSVAKIQNTYKDLLILGINVR
jgi:phosphinothricin acetyltransferase